MSQRNLSRVGYNIKLRASILLSATMSIMYSSFERVRNNASVLILLSKRFSILFISGEQLILLF